MSFSSLHSTSFSLEGAIQALQKEPDVNGEEQSITSRQKFSPGWRFQSIFLCMCLLTLANALDATTIGVALPVISTDLHLEALQAFWVGTSFLLSSTVWQPTLSSLSHTFGRLPLLLLSLALFAIGSIIAALCQNFEALLAGRTIQGLGAGGLRGLTEVILTDLVPLRKRGTYYGYMAGTWAVGSVCGPLIGGVFAELGDRAGGWRWIFWINIPIAVLASVLLPWLLRLKEPMKGISFSMKIKSVDWIGAMLLTGSTTAILIPASWGGIQYPWTSYRTLVSLLMGLLGFAGWVVWEVCGGHANPLVKMSIFNNWTAATSYFGIFVQGIVLWCLVFYLPLYYEACHAYSPLKAGIATLPETLTVAPVAFAAGIAISRVGKYRWSIWTGWLVTVIGLGLMWFLNEDTKVPIWIALNLMPGIGIGLLFPGLEYATQAAAGQKDVAHAAAMYNFIRSFGQGIGVAVGGSIFQGQFEKALVEHPEVREVAVQFARDAAALVHVLKQMSRSGESAVVARILEKAYADSLKVVWAIMAGLSALALLSTFLTKELGLDEELDSKQGLKK